ncbi:hypothetical protein ACQP2T_25920 [Nonomuraea sp. CA-143628]
MNEPNLTDGLLLGPGAGHGELDLLPFHPRERADGDWRTWKSDTGTTSTS